MIDAIQKAIYKNYKEQDIKWLFLSLYDDAWTCVWSQWSIQPEKDLKTIIPLLYNAIVSDKTITSAVVDVVIDMQEILQKNDLSWLDMATHGMCVLASWVSGVILPWTTWISSSKDALSAIKSKYSLTWKIRIFGFTTDRIVVA